MELIVKDDNTQVSAQLIGRLDTAAAADFSTEMQPLFDKADQQITLDCSKLEYISSSGLRHLLSLRKATMAKGGKVIISGVNDEIKQVFIITGFASLFEFE